MSSDRDTTRAVRSWLREGVTELPDRVLDQVLDQLPATRQRRSWWKIWSRSVASRSLPIALAAVVLLAIVGVATVSPSLDVGGGGQPSAPTPTSPQVLPEYPRALAPGTYFIDDPFPVRVTFEVPEGWMACRWNSWELGPCTSPNGRGVAFTIVDNVVADPCDTALLDPPVGPSVDDLVTELSGLRGFGATDPIDINVDGFSGQELELTAPRSPGCSLATWSTADRINGVAPNEVNLLRILDVDGVRLLIAAAHQPGETSQDELDELRRVMDSVRIEP
jgi:hypothetical protein